MMSSGYVSRIQVACTKGMDTRTQAPSPKAVDFDFAEVDSATGTRLRQVRVENNAHLCSFECTRPVNVAAWLHLNWCIVPICWWQLFQDKIVAVGNEDYDEAKRLKVEGFNFTVFSLQTNSFILL